MLQMLLLPICLLPLQATPLQGEVPVAVHARFKALATNPARLEKESQLAQGCREDIGQLIPGQPENHENIIYANDCKHGGMPLDLSNEIVHTFPASEPILQSDREALTEQERRPWFNEPELRAPLPFFSLTDSTGAGLSTDGFLGKVIILHFFNPTCPNLQMLPDLVRLQSLQSKFSFRVLPVAVGITHLQSLTRFRKMNADLLPPEFQLFLFGKGRGEPQSIFKDFVISPTTYILDREGRVAWRICGSIPGALTDRINHILSEVPTIGNPAEKTLP